MKKRAYLLFVLSAVAVICIGFLFAAKQPEKKQIAVAEKVLTNLLNAPNQKLEALYDETANTTDLSLDGFTERFAEMYSELLEHCGTDLFIESCIRLNEITSLQFYAYNDGFHIRLQELLVNQTRQQNAYAYDAVLLVNVDGQENQTIQANGMVQFDDDGKIRAITFRSREFFKLQT